MSKLVKQPAPALYRSKVHHVQKAFDVLAEIRIQLRLKRSVRWACASMARILEDYPPGLYSNSIRGHKTPLCYVDSHISKAKALVYSDTIIDSFDWEDYDHLDLLLSESLEMLNKIVEEAEANAPCYWREGDPQPQRLKPLPVARKNP